MNDPTNNQHDEQPDWRDALAAVREALDIPYPKTAGDEETYRAILDRRTLQALTMLRAVLDDGADVAWHVAYLRERLATMPAEGYAGVGRVSAEIIELHAARLDRAETKLRALLADVDELRAKLVKAIAAENAARPRLRPTREDGTR